MARKEPDGVRKIRRDFVESEFPEAHAINEEFRIEMTRYQTLRMLWIKSRRLVPGPKKKRMHT